MKMTLLVLITILFVACGPSDEKISQEVSAGLSSVSSSITASVQKGVVTLSGECPDDPCKTNSETAVQKIKGVKQVVNNITVAPPPPPPVVINPDDSLNTAVGEITKGYSTVKASVSDGVITLTGNIKRSQLTGLMQKISAIKPKKIDNQLQIK